MTSAKKFQKDKDDLGRRTNVQMVLPKKCPESTLRIATDILHFIFLGLFKVVLASIVATWNEGCPGLQAIHP
uniref:Uncharacterized protein n=1 Tax=Vespula pensylvanica TaxID=30213 RepID=A0A834N2B3_VESPE|nr:hypothetical protein H0235_017418 [Vespula pensylvanica]